MKILKRSNTICPRPQNNITRDVSGAARRRTHTSEGK